MNDEEKEKLITKALMTERSLNRIAQAMVNPLRHPLNYQSVARKFKIRRAWSRILFTKFCQPKNFFPNGKPSIIIVPVYYSEFSKKYSCLVFTRTYNVQTGEMSEWMSHPDINLKRYNIRKHCQPILGLPEIDAMMKPILNKIYNMPVRPILGSALAKYIPPPVQSKNKKMTRTINKLNELGLL